jgi:hypothetical protein
LLFLLFVGGNPQFLNVALVNLDQGTAGGQLAYLINNTESLETIPYGNWSSAYDSVRIGNCYCAFLIPENFTEHLNERMMSRQLHANASVIIALDYASYIVTTVLENQLRVALNQLVQLRYNVSMSLYQGKRFQQYIVIAC